VEENHPPEPSGSLLDHSNDKDPYPIKPQIEGKMDSDILQLDEIDDSEILYMPQTFDGSKAELIVSPLSSQSSEVLLPQKDYVEDVTDLTMSSTTDGGPNDALPRSNGASDVLALEKESSLALANELVILEPQKEVNKTDLSESILAFTSEAKLNDGLKQSQLAAEKESSLASANELVILEPLKEVSKTGLSEHIVEFTSEAKLNDGLKQSPLALEKESSLASANELDILEPREEVNKTDLSEPIPEFTSEEKLNDGQKHSQEADSVHQSQQTSSVTRPHIRDDNIVTPSASSPGVNELTQAQAHAVSKAATQAPKSSNPSKLTRKSNLSKAQIDNSAPFESVKEAVSKFGGIVDWKAHRAQTMERRTYIEQELEKVQEEIPVYKKLALEAEETKVKMLKDLDSTKRFSEELKLNVERAQTEERQARQDAQLANLRVEEMEQGIADEASVAAKAQLEVARARHAAAVAELKIVRDELEQLHKDYDMIVHERDLATKRANDAVSTSKEVEKTLEDLMIELIALKENLESAHATHLEAEEQRISTAMAMEQDTLMWEKELKLAEDEVEKLNQKILSAKHLKSKLDTASALLIELKGELATYMENREEGQGKLKEPEKRTHADIQEAITLAKKELQTVKSNIEKASDAVNCLSVSAMSLKSELEREKSSLTASTAREGATADAISSLEAELRKINSDLEVLRVKEREARERMSELPNQLEQAVLEADQSKSVAQTASEDLVKAKEELEEAKSGVDILKCRLCAVQKETEAARVSEKLALAAINALKESELAQGTDTDDSLAAMTLSVEEYYELRKRAHDAEEDANLRVSTAVSQIELAKESEIMSLKKLDLISNELSACKETLEFAMQKAEKAKEEKSRAEQELKRWRAENDQHQISSESASDEKTKKMNFINLSKGALNVNQTSPTGNALENHNEADSSAEVKVTKKKKRSFFPRIFMFLARRKQTSK
ncbi:hypothetical protein NMG60_11024230, partial [Bertholletia excelsa]